MNQDAPEDAYYNSWLTGLFPQDDFKVHPRLTVSLDLRCDIQTPLTGPQDREQTSVRGVQSTLLPSAPPAFSLWVIRAWSEECFPCGAGIFFGSVSGNGWAQLKFTTVRDWAAVQYTSLADQSLC
jgi:hypothetical protein